MSFVKNEFQQLKWHLTQVLTAPYSLLSSSTGDKFVLLKPVLQSLSMLFLAADKHVQHQQCCVNINICLLPLAYHTVVVIAVFI